MHTTTTTTTVPMPGPLGRRGFTGRVSTVFAAAVTAMLALTFAAGPVSAVESDETPAGWARVAHLSPDTKSVDVQLTAVAGGEVLFDLEDVAYGDVSDYLRLAVGTYVVSMTPADATIEAEPAISELINVKEGEPVTLAALGSNAELTTKVIYDDLTPPADGEARVRVLQASTVNPSVDIKTVSGMVITAGAQSGEVTGYATVDDGPWDLLLTAGAVVSEAKIELESNSVNTLLVLDNASGGLTIKHIEDSISVTSTPVGGTNTGAAVQAAEATGTEIAQWSVMGTLVLAMVLALLTVGGSARKALAASGRRQ
ncbi:DUF4397 domain-containing protein [Arthrobacter sp. H41]|uniref:DUF4397 domain-containing protein n=1 Tax=Arthrobacter sp. H41 TaxID=1312978 RepID=UPI00047B41CB|nr:DUF4397 domain-containing protein [Arthrobacter sp. H41]